MAVAVIDVEQWCTWFEPALAGGERRAIQFIGRAGRGKTTRMLVLAARFAQSSYTYIAEDEPCPPIPWGKPILIDEAQRLPRAARSAVFSSGAPLVLATHRCLARTLARFGYLVTTIRIGAQNHEPLLREMVRRRIDASRHREGPLPQLSAHDAAQLIRRFGTDFRAIENFLYEQVQAQCYSHGEMRFID